MGWLSVLRALLSIAGSLTQYLHDKQMLDAGAATAIANGLKESQDAIEQARKARDDATRKFDERGGVPDDNDPNLRD